VTTKGREDDDVTTTSVTPSAGVPMRGGAASPADACLVVIYGPDLGRRIALERTTFAIGRSSKSDLPLEQDSVSRNHARIARTHGAWVLSDLGSTNGTYVNDVAVTERDLRDGDRIKIGRTILKFMTGSNVEASYHEEIYRLMTVDGLTQVFNKRYFHEAIEREVNRAVRYKRKLSLLLFDLDHFKRKNDEYGHVAGDAILRHVAQTLVHKLRREDIFARVGGEEFAVLLPEIDVEGAFQTAEKVRHVVEQTPCVFDGVAIACTVSVGVATLAVPVNTAQLLYERADAALYRAKGEGRNRVKG
jgi:diguanylate cyclase (GGDEF)-like protein